MIERNKNPAGRISNLIFGLCGIFDGIIRVLSCGFLHTTTPLDYARRQARSAIKRLKENATKRS